MHRIALTLLLFVGLHSQALSAPVPVERLTAEKDAEFEKLWNDIGWYQPDAVKFWCRLHANPKAGYAFLDRKIEPIQLSEAAGKRLIDDLGSDDVATWQAAEKKLWVRDIRLAMNFLDAWDYAKTDFQRDRLCNACFFMEQYPQYYDFTLKPIRNLKGEVEQYELRMSLRAGVPKGIQLQFGLDLGGCMQLDQITLASPNNWGSPEQTMIRYLSGHQGRLEASLLERLGTGHPQIGATKIARAAIQKRSERSLRQMGPSLLIDELPQHWDQWGPYSTSGSDAAECGRWR